MPQDNPLLSLRTIHYYASGQSITMPQDNILLCLRTIHFYASGQSNTIPQENPLLCHQAEVHTNTSTSIKESPSFCLNESVQSLHLKWCSVVLNSCKIWWPCVQALYKGPFGGLLTGSMGHHGTRQDKSRHIPLPYGTFRQKSCRTSGKNPV